ncbi:ankyrin [Coprinopsis marcescibilis]|uniref:Ankyrin n=1 Tax=Coprinopsis marcescibilis TaxID=230819 RepID=A0A5C3KEG5_COPMA|nr:ankyrin [Coprinopsis marcescibilis]
MMAAGEGHHGVVALLLESYAAVEVLLEVEGIDIHCIDGQGRTLLMSAARGGEVEMVNRFLGLGLGANINVSDIEGKTALFHAAESDWTTGPDIVSALLEIEGIDCSVQDVKGRTPLMVATEHEYEDIVELLR